MAIVIELKPEIEARLIAQAAAAGISVEEFLRSGDRRLVHWFTTISST